MPRVDYYRVSRVSRDISDDEIKKAYRKLVFEHHPDRNPNNSKAEEKIREINSPMKFSGIPRASAPTIACIGARRCAGDRRSALILEEMEKKLSTRGRKEVFAVLMKMVPRIKSELAIIRERTVAHQGYDTFKEPIVEARGAEVLDEFVTPEMEQRKHRLLEVAVQMMVSQPWLPGATKADSRATWPPGGHVPEGTNQRVRHGAGAAVSAQMNREGNAHA